MTLGGVELDGWDFATFGALAVAGAGLLGVVVLILGLPGRFALARSHPEAEAVNLMGWLGIIAVVPWFQALLWAFKPTNVVDLRRWPDEEKRAIAGMIQALKNRPDGQNPSSNPAQIETPERSPVV